MSKQKSPAFQFYYKEWLTGTMHLTRIERDIYLTLLIYSFDLDGLPDNGKLIERYASVKTKVERDALAVVLAKFHKDDDGKLRNKTMEKVRKSLKDFKESKSEAGKEGAKKRWQKDSTAIVLPLAKNGSASTTASSSSNTFFNTAKGEKHFDHMLHFFSLPYSEQMEGFRGEYSKQDYDRFADILKKTLHDFPQLKTKFNRCMNIGEWINGMNRCGYGLIKQGIEKMLGYSIAPDAEMAYKIKSFIPEKSDKVYS